MEKLTWKLWKLEGILYVTNLPKSVLKVNIAKTCFPWKFRLMPVNLSWVLDIFCTFELRLTLRLHHDRYDHYFSACLLVGWTGLMWISEYCNFQTCCSWHVPRWVEPISPGGKVTWEKRDWWLAIDRSSFWKWSTGGLVIMRASLNVAGCRGHQ